LISGGIGFAPGKGARPNNDLRGGSENLRTAVEAARRKILAEFMNRMTKCRIPFLKEHHLRTDFGPRTASGSGIHHGPQQERSSVFQCSDQAKDMLLQEGLDFKYGARHLKRSLNDSSSIRFESLARVRLDWVILCTSTSTS